MMILTLGLIIEGEFFLSLSLSLSLRRSFIYRTNSAFSHAELSFSFSFSFSSSFSLDDDDDDDDVFTTLFIRAFLSRADIFLLFLSLFFLCSQTTAKIKNGEPSVHR
jgi:hypothetical protein